MNSAAAPAALWFETVAITSRKADGSWASKRELGRTATIEGALDLVAAHAGVARSALVSEYALGVYVVSDAAGLELARVTIATPPAALPAGPHWTRLMV
jgi:hypothetical protein